MLTENALYQNSHPRTRALPVGPIDGHAALEAHEQFMRDHFEVDPIGWTGIGLT